MLRASPLLLCLWNESVKFFVRWELPVLSSFMSQKEDRKKGRESSETSETLSTVGTLRG